MVGTSIFLPARTTKPKPPSIGLLPRRTTYDVSLTRCAPPAVPHVLAIPTPCPAVSPKSTRTDRPGTQPLVIATCDFHPDCHCSRTEYSNAHGGAPENKAARPPPARRPGKPATRAPPRRAAAAGSPRRANKGATRPATSKARFSRLNSECPEV